MHPRLTAINYVCFVLLAEKIGLESTAGFDPLLLLKKSPSGIWE